MTSSSLCSSLSAIVALNSEGIQHLENKDFAKAIASLSAGIGDLKRLLSDESEDFCRSHDLAFGFEMAHFQEVDDNDDTATPFVFDTPIRVQPRRRSSRAASRSTHDKLKMLSFALVFNLAIAFHLGALRHHQNSSSGKVSSTTRKRLLKALAFYNMSLSMIQNNEGLSLGVMESLAVANNQANVYVLLGNAKEAEACNEEVLQNIMYVADSGHQQEVPLFDRFFANVGVKPSPTATAA